MKDIADLKTKKFVIYPADVVPFRAIDTGAGRRELLKKFSFKDAKLTQQPLEWTFLGGTVSRDEDETVVIENCQISEKRIVLEVRGSSVITNDVFEQIKEALVEPIFGGGERWKDAGPVVETCDTTCVATLDFDWTALIAPEFSSFAQGSLLEASSNKQAKASIRNATLVIGLTYDATDSAVKEHGITFADKPFLIQPRLGTPLSDRRYTTASPTDSETHFDLVRELEAMLTKHTPS